MGNSNDNVQNGADNDDGNGEMCHLIRIAINLTCGDSSLFVSKLSGTKQSATDLEPRIRRWIQLKCRATKLLCGPKRSYVPSKSHSRIHSIYVAHGIRLIIARTQPLASNHSQTNPEIEFKWRPMAKAGAVMHHASKWNSLSELKLDFRTDRK